MSPTPLLSARFMNVTYMNIDLLPYSEVVGVEGKGGDFKCLCRSETSIRRSKTLYPL